MRVMTLGTFDMFHAGHVDLLAGCRALVQDPEVIVGLNTDDFVRRYKGRPPVLYYSDRKTVLEACRYVDFVQPNPMDPSVNQFEGIIRVRPSVIAVGSDWEGKDYLGQLGVTQAVLDRHSITIIYLPRPNPPRISTTNIRDRVIATHHLGDPRA